MVSKSQPVASPKRVRRADVSLARLLVQHAGRSFARKADASDKFMAAGGRYLGGVVGPLKAPNGVVKGRPRKAGWQVAANEN